MSRAATVQRVATWTAVAAGALGLTTATGCGAIPPGPPELAWLFHPLLFLLGGAGGYLTVVRGREADARRWRTLEDPHLTSGEREWAYKEAERERRAAGTSFLLAPTLLGYWLANQLPTGEAIGVSDFLPLPPLIGFGVGLAVGSWKLPEKKPDEGSF